MTTTNAVDVQATAASELEALALRDCERSVQGLVARRCGVCPQCQDFRRFLGRVDFLRWLYFRTPPERR